MKNSQRTKFYNKLTEIVDESTAQDNVFGLVFVDIKNFRLLNAQYGYDIGDRVLSELESRLDIFAQNGNHLYPLEGGVFALILTELHDHNFIPIVISKILAELSPEIHFSGQKEIYVEFYFGYSFFPNIANNPDKLFATVEANLLATKKKGQAFLLLSDTKIEKSMGDYELNSALLKAIEYNEFDFHYQPKISTSNTKLVSAEALARWNHPELGMISPEIFINMLERSGHIVDFTKMALHNVLRQMKDWPSDSISVSVNASAKNIQDQSFPKIVQSALKIWGADPSRLIIEVTESGVINDKETGFQVLSVLRDMGVKISIDDFGTGYSSMEYFKSLPATEVKIDQTFVRNMVNNIEDQHLVEIMLSLAHKFNMDAVAEGVEDKATLDLLTSLGADIIQGYYYSKPLANDDFVAWMKDFNKDSD
jgi:diguanylate cyclase (GGDEF)-like protein